MYAIFNKLGWFVGISNIRHDGYTSLSFSFLWCFDKRLSRVTKIRIHELELPSDSNIHTIANETDFGNMCRIIAPCLTDNNTMRTYKNYIDGYRIDNRPMPNTFWASCVLSVVFRPNEFQIRENPTFSTFWFCDEMSWSCRLINKDCTFIKKSEWVSTIADYEFDIIRANYIV